MVNLDATKVRNKVRIINFLFDFILKITNSLALKTNQSQWFRAVA